MGKASISIAITSSYNGKGVRQAQESVRKLTASLVAMRGGIGSADVIAGSKLAEAAGQLDNLGASMRRVGDSLTKGVTVPMAAAATASVAATTQIDTAWYNVRKTVDATEGEYQRLRQSAVDMSKTSPVSAETILNVEGLGGQLGIAKENLQSFAETVTGLDIATNLDAETAAMQLSQFMNITGAAQQESGNLGSTIVDLGNHFATTESDIMNMSTRLASAGSQAGMTDADIMGISTALSAMGMRAEAGGSAMSRVINDINSSVATGSDSLKDYAEVAGMSAEEFAEKWRKDAAGTFAEFVAKLGEAGEATGSTQVILDRLGISEIRTSDAMRRLAGNSDLVKSAISRANTAYEENTALAREVDERNNSLESRFGTLKNQAVAAADAFGGPVADAALGLAEEHLTPLLQSIEDVGRAFADMPKSQQQTVLGFAAVAAAAGPVLSVGGRLVQGMGKVVDWCGRVRQSQGILKAAMHETDDGMLQQLAANKDATAQMGLLQNSYVRAAGGIDSYVEKARAFTDALSEQERQAGLAEVAQDRYMAALADASTSVEDATLALAEARAKASESMRDESEAIARDHEAKLRAKEANKNLQDAYDKLTDAQKLRISALNDEMNAEDRRARAVGDAVAVQSEAMMKAREAQQKLSEAIERVKDSQQRFVESSESAITVKNRQSEAEKAYRDAVKASGEGSDEAQAALVRLAEANRDMRTVNQDVSDSFKDLRKAQSDVRSSMEEVKSAGVGVKEAQAQVAEAMRSTGEEARALGEAERVQAEAQRNYDSALKEATEATKAKRDAAENLQSVYKGNRDAAKQVADAEGRLCEAAERYHETAAKGVEAVGDLVLTKEEDVKVSQKVQEANKGIQSKLKDFVGSGKMAKTSLEDVGDAALAMGDATGDAFKSTQTGAAKMSGAVAGSMGTMAKKVGGAVSAMGAAFKAMLPMLAIGAIVAGVTAIAGALTDASDRTKRLADSSKRLEGTSTHISGLGDNYRVAGEKAKAASSLFSHAGDTIKDATDKIIENNNALADSIDQTKLDYRVDLVNLDLAGQRILELASSSEWSASKQEQLKTAVENYNSVAGTQWEVVEGTNGVIRDNSAVTKENAGIILDLADAIGKSTEKRKDELKYLAYEEMYKEAYKNREKAVMELADAEEAYAADSSKANKERLEEARQAAQDSESMLTRVESSYEGVKAAQDAAGQSLGDFVGANKDYADSFSAAGDKAGSLMATFESMGVTASTVAEMGVEDVRRLATAYDGSFDSMAASLVGMGYNLEEFGVTASGFAASSETFTNAFSQNFNRAFESGDAALASLASALDKCGYSTTDLASLTESDLQKIALSWNGNTAQLIGSLSDLGVQMPLLGQLAASGWKTAIDDGALGAVAAVANAKGLTVQELNEMTQEMESLGNGGMVAFAEGLASGTITAGMSAEEVKAKVEQIMGSMNLEGLTAEEVDAAITRISSSAPLFGNAVMEGNISAEDAAQQLDLARYTGEASKTAAEAAKNPEGYAGAQHQNNAAQEQAAQENATPEIVEQKTQEAAENASDPGAFGQAGAENAQATGEGYRSADITGPVNEAVRSALADALAGNTDGARQTGRALGEGIVEGIGNADVSSAGQKVGETLTASLGAVDVSAAGKAMGQRVAEAVAATDLTAAGQTVANTLVAGFNAYDFTVLGAEAGSRINAGFTTSMLITVGTAALHGAVVGQSFSQAFSASVAAFDAAAAGTALASSARAGIMAADFTTPGIVAGSMAVAGFAMSAASAYAPGLALGSSFARGVSAGAAPAAGYASAAARAASSAIGSGVGAARSAGTKTGSQFAAGIRSQASAATASGKSLSLVSVNALNAGASAARSNGSKLGSQFAAGIRSQASAVRSAAGTLASATAAVANSNWRASGWGAELGANFARGIRSQASAVASAAAALASAAAGPLHHSTPDWGPLVHDDLWGGEMVENIAASMERATPSLARAASRVAGTMAGADASSSVAAAPRAQGVQAGNVYNIAIDGRSVQSDPALRSAVEGLVDAVARRANMGR